MRADWLTLAHEEARRAAARLGLPPARTPRVWWNERLRTVAGRYCARENRIELNPHYCLRFGLAEVVATVRHEVCHVGPRPGTALLHGAELFRARLLRLSAPNHCLAMPRSFRRRSGVRYRYRCPACTVQVTYARRVRGLACRACCERVSGGRFDPRFRLKLATSTRRAKRRAAPRTDADGSPTQLALFGRPPD